MINPTKLFNISDYLEIFIRRIWYIIIPFIIIMIAAASYAVLTPKKYLASTTILVTPQKVPADYVRATVTLGVEARIQSISQEIMSRTRLEKIVSEFNLYSEEAKKSPQEEIIEMMRKDIWVKVGGREGYFNLSYMGKDPKITAMVANKLTSLYIEENLKLREQQAKGTSEFLLFELNSTKGKLEEQEKAIAIFKRKHLAELPEQRDSNLRVLQQLQLDHQRISDSLKATQERKLIIQKQVSEIKAMTKAMTVSLTNSENLKEESPLSKSSLILSENLPTTLPKGTARTPENELLNQLKSQLTDMQAKYTDKHPDIVTTRKKIMDLEKKIAANIEKEEKMKVEKEKEKEIHSPQSMLSASDTPPKGKKDEKINEEQNFFYKEMESQLVATDSEVRRLKEEETKIKTKMAEYQTRIENAPARELEVISLNRDYDNTKQSYNALLSKSLESQQAENLERRQQGEQFRVIDPARIPEKPFKPNIPKIILMGFLAGICSGFGLAFFKEQWDRSFKDAEDVETTLGLKVLANIPKIETSKA